MPDSTYGGLWTGIQGSKNILNKLLESVKYLLPPEIQFMCFKIYFSQTNPNKQR